MVLRAKPGRLSSNSQQLCVLSPDVSLPKPYPMTSPHAPDIIAFARARVWLRLDGHWNLVDQQLPAPATTTVESTKAHPAMHRSCGEPWPTHTVGPCHWHGLVHPLPTQHPPPIQLPPPIQHPLPIQHPPPIQHPLQTAR